MEQWVSIPGYEGYYEVSDLGRVRSIDRIVKGNVPGRVNRLKGKVLRDRVQNAGYRVVTLCKEGKPADYLVHALVLTSFVGPCPADKRECLHRDHNKHNNVLTNLRWGTREENILDSCLDGRRAQKLTIEQVEEIRELYATGKYTQEKVGEKFGVSQVMIGRIVRNKNWTW